MARKKKNGGGMSTVRKWGKRILSGVRVVVIGVTSGHGVIYGASQVAGGGAGLDKFPRETIWAYTGYNTDDGSFNRDQATKSVVTIGLGLAAAWLIGLGI